VGRKVKRVPPRGGLEEITVAASRRRVLVEDEQRALDRCLFLDVDPHCGWQTRAEGRGQRDPQDFSLVALDERGERLLAPRRRRKELIHETRSFDWASQPVSGIQADERLDEALRWRPGSGGRLRESESGADEEHRPDGEQTGHDEATPPIHEGPPLPWKAPRTLLRQPGCQD